MWKERRILRQQLELLAENSKRGSADELPRNSSAMAELFKSLRFNEVIFAVMLMDFIINFVILIHKLFGRQIG